MLPVLSDPPRLQGRFRVDAELARGGMGTVFSAWDDSSGKRVALKRLTPDAPPRMAALFEREFYVLASLKHPRIIDVYDYGIDADGPYYTMELLEGSDLRELSPLPPLQACRYLRDVASSLALLHARRLLHRDVSPRNVRTLPDGSCKLIDFGALASFGLNEELVGTPPVIPPEALAGQPLDQRADLYSLGTLAYFLLTGRHAYPARSVSALPEIWLEKPVPPSLHVPDVPPALDTLVMSLLNLDMLGRPASAAEVIDRLHAIAGLEPERDEHAARAYFVGAALVERDDELERMQRRLKRTKAGQGDAVFVAAEAGLGKTRFLEEVALRAQLAGITTLRANASAHSSPLSTANALVQQLFRLLPKSAAKIFLPHAATLHAVWPDLVELQPNTTEAQLERSSSSAALTALPTIIEACLRELSRKQPLLIAVDNVEHADPQSAALLMTLARAARTERLLVVTTASLHTALEFSAAVRAIRDAGTSIQLRTLTENGVIALVRTAFGDVLHVRRTATRLFASTGGNPEHCMRVLQRWVDNGLIQYLGGAWNLPIEIAADALLRAEHVLQDRLRHCSNEARQVAAILAVLDRPAALEWCIALEAANQPSRAVITALDELVQAQVLSQTSEGYRFLHDPLRVALLESMDAVALSSLQLRVGEALLAQPEPVLTQMQAGLLLIRAGEELRGAELIATLARAALAAPTDCAPLLANAAKALEAALDVYRRCGRSRLAQLELLVPLVVASHLISPAFAHRYTNDTIAGLEHALGLDTIGETRASLDAGSLRLLLRAAPVLVDGDSTTATTPDAITLVSWLIRCVMAGVATAAAAIDHETQAKLAQALQPFETFGRNHPAAAAYEYCRLVIGMSEGRPAASHQGWSDLLSRLGELGFAPHVQRRLRLGALYSLGVLESQRDDDAALQRMQDIERDGSALSAAYADQLRFLYYGFRGNIELAQRYRDRVEAHAVQYGSAWQVEMWSTCTLSSVYSNTRDAAGNKRVVEQLERLKQTAPSLTLYWERAVATQLRLTGASARAIELYKSMFARSGPRERVGWSSVRGGFARAYNDLEQYEAAKRVCEETLALSEEDLAFVAVTLTVRCELCRALAGLGDFGAAKAQLTGLFELYTPNQNPVTLGALHRTGAEIAKLEDDTPTFDDHVAAMQRWYQPTRNPALIAQCDQLRNAAANDNFRRDARANAASPATVITEAQSVLAMCEGAQARKQRALELVAAQAAVSEAWLFTRGPDNQPVVIGKLGVTDPPSNLVPMVRSLFELIPDDSDDTVFVQNPAELATTAVEADVTAPYRLLPLAIDQGDERILVGMIAFPNTGAHRGVHHGFLQDVATQLFQAGDLVTVRRID